MSINFAFYPTSPELKRYTIHLQGGTTSSLFVLRALENEEIAVYWVGMIRFYEGTVSGRAGAQRL